MARKILLSGLLLAGVVCLVQGSFIQVKAVAAQYLLQSAWSETLRTREHRRPWPWADTWPVARLSLPARGIDQVVLADATGRSLAFAPGHLTESVMPGDEGVSIISAHRDTHFRFLRDLRTGDTFSIQRMDGQYYVFQVQRLEIITSEKAFSLLGDSGAYVLLTTCYPFDTVRSGGPLRYVVIARRIGRNVQDDRAA